MTDTPWQSGVPPESWNEHQTKLAAHFLQGRAWALFQEARGKKIFYAAGTHWSWLAILEENRFGSRLYTPYGPTATSPAGLKNALGSLLSCGAASGVDFIRIEPHAPQAKKMLKGYPAKHAHRDIQPKHTLIKDLDHSEEALYSEMASTNRRLYRRAEESGFSFDRRNDPAAIRIFLDMIHEVAARTGIQPHSDEYFTTMANVLLPQKAATLFVTYHNKKPVASCIVFEDATTRYYAHAATAESARKLQPGVPLMGHIIFDAKAQGRLHFDYYGVAPPHSENHTWAGLSQFKRSFGGHEVEYSGTWEIPIKKARYQAYRLLRRIRKK
jgi:lipid II:glycine glycyltransferase (peptidoglycan interpeptide bridge formation enzyme)